MAVIVETARAKVNLTLAIHGKRADGYHELASLVAFAERPADVIVLDTGLPKTVETMGPFAGGIAGPNLLQTVLDLAIAAEPALEVGSVRLEKQLPVAAGIGGGSADAAALLRALRRANPQHAERIDWSAIARRLGADVPVCLLNRAAWMTGVGEVLSPIAGLPRLDVVLVNPMVAVPADKTAQVFRALAAGPLDAGAGDAPPPRVVRRDALLALIDSGNDLETAARMVIPAIGDVLAALRASQGCEVAAMSGAGPTCFGVFDDAGKARDVAASLAARHPSWWIAAARVG